MPLGFECSVRACPETRVERCATELGTVHTDSPTDLASHSEGPMLHLSSLCRERAPHLGQQSILDVDLAMMMMKCQRQKRARRPRTSESSNDGQH